jgi:putative iron-regulated protein
MTVELTAGNLRRQHGLTDDTDVILGFHALEFLLWGEQGERPVEDYHERLETSTEELDMGLTLVDLPTNRRRSLLLLLSHLLQDDLLKLQQQWQDPYSPLAYAFYQLDSRSRLQLLKDASKQLLEEYTAGTLASEADSSSRLAIALGAVQELWVEGEQPLIDWLGEESERTNWQRQLQELQSLATAYKAGESSEAQLAELHTRLLVLAEIFESPVLEP